MQGFIWYTFIVGDTEEEYYIYNLEKEYYLFLFQLYYHNMKDKYQQTPFFYF